VIFFGKRGDSLKSKEKSEIEQVSVTAKYTLEKPPPFDDMEDLRKNS